MLLRFKIMRDCRTGEYVILDRLKRKSCIQDNRYTKTHFPTRENAEGFIYGVTGNKRYLTATLSGTRDVTLSAWAFCHRKNNVKV